LSAAQRAQTEKTLSKNLGQLADAKAQHRREERFEGKDGKSYKQKGKVKGPITARERRCRPCTQQLGTNTLCKSQGGERNKKHRESYKKRLREKKVEKYGKVQNNLRPGWRNIISNNPLWKKALEGSDGQQVLVADLEVSSRAVTSLPVSLSLIVRATVRSPWRKVGRPSRCADPDHDDVPLHCESGVRGPVGRPVLRSAAPRGPRQCPSYVEGERPMVRCRATLRLTRSVNLAALQPAARNRPRFRPQQNR
jgi:hypothetical protein